MKKMMLTLLLMTNFVGMNACGGTYFDDGTRARKLLSFVSDANVHSAQKLLTSCNVAKEMRFKRNGEETYKSVVGRTLELGCSPDKQKRKSMLPLIRLLKKYNFPALPEDVETARRLAGRDLNGNKGALELSQDNLQPCGVYARGLVRMVERMPVLVRQPEDADYEPEVIEIVI